MPSQHVPNALAAYAGWPVANLALDALIVRAGRCRQGVLATARANPPRHTAYLVELDAQRIWRASTGAPVRVTLRRLAHKHAGLQLAARTER